MHKAHKSRKQLNLPKQLHHISSSISINTITKHRECILFPTYAKRNSKDPNEWVIRIKGWALTLKSTGPKQKVLKGITKSVAGKKSTNELSNKMFEHRFKYFLANGKKNRHFHIEATHAVDPIPFNYRNRDSFTTMWNKSFEYPSLESIVTSSPSSIILNSTSFTSLSSSTSSLNNNSTDDEEEDDDRDYRPPITEQGVTLISESTGVFSGELHVSNDQIRKWNYDTHQERIIKIKSFDLSKKESDLSSFFPTSYGLVNLIEPFGVSIISDIDDTIKCTKVLSGARTVLTNTFFNPTRAVPGMADIYLQWYKLGASFHYVSNSPFQLTHMLNSFMTNHCFPPGSFHLRESTGLLSKLVSSKPGRSKHDSICGIMRDFPNRKFILIGDSGEIDLEIYTRVAMEFPGQVIKIFIRDITTTAIKKTKKKKYRPTHRNASFPSFFTSNTPKTPISDNDEDSDYLDMPDTANKLAELVLEPTLTGHGPIVPNSSPENIHDFVHLVTAPQPPSHNLMQLQTRLLHARGLLKDIDIVLFKDAKELCNDEKVQHVLHNFI